MATNAATYNEDGSQIAADAAFIYDLVRDHVRRVINGGGSGGMSASVGPSTRAATPDSSADNVSTPFASLPPAAVAPPAPPQPTAPAAAAPSPRRKLNLIGDDSDSSSSDDDDD